MTDDAMRPRMTAEDFVRKWGRSALGESQGAQQHFIDLCDMLGEARPAEADPTAADYCFEKAAAKTDGRPGRADVWKRGCFAWEYKAPGRDLQAAYAQLQRYAPALANPPLLIVSDMRDFRVHTNWTNAVTQRHDIALNDLLDPDRRRILKWAFADPERLRPGRTRAMLTEEVAGRFAALADRLARRGHDPWDVAHFLMRLVFCMFAEDVGLLPDTLFSELLDEAARDPQAFVPLAETLFRSMRDGGRVGFKAVEWFNGGLFKDAGALPLEPDDLALVREAARLDWADIDPTILGTLFERGLTPERRAALARAVVRRDRAGLSEGAVGVHYTPEPMILRLVEPVVTRPLKREWAAVRGRIAALLDEARRSAPAARARARKEARTLYDDFLGRLRRVRVLDPACGSGNFLYLALRELKDLEHAVVVDGEAFGFIRQYELDLKGVAWPRTIGPEAVMGIDVNPMGVELARISVWIGFIQWMLRHGEDVPRNPILKSLETIAQKDALINPIGGEERWLDESLSEVVIVGNPPFLGDKAMLGDLGADYVTRLRRLFEGRVPGGADLVCYWFEKARALVEEGRVARVGLVATNGIRGGANRRVLDRIRATGTIFEAWSDEPWRQNGAAVRVSLVCFGPKGVEESPRLDGREVPEIFSDLTGGGVDLTAARPLAENGGVCFQGPVKVGAFDVPGDLARSWLALPLNPNGRLNLDVLRPWINGMDVVRRPSDTWIIDFGLASMEEACLYEAPFAHIEQHVRGVRASNRRERRRMFWWQHGETAPGLKAAVSRISRCIVTPRVARHRLFVWAHPSVLPDSRINLIARDDDVTFGILHSRTHELWSLRLGGRHGVGNDPQYTPSTGFETFPFPEGLTPDRPASAYAGDPRAQAIAAAARMLDERRETWLNPPDLVTEVDEVVPGFPKRLLPKDERAAAILKTRTLTNLYNNPPAWLKQAHAALDAAVAAAYGWPADLSDEEVLARLLALNHARPAAAGKKRKARRKVPNPAAPEFLYSFTGGKAQPAVSAESNTAEAKLASVPLKQSPDQRKAG